jgi:NAD+ diphosphatase
VSASRFIVADSNNTHPLLDRAAHLRSKEDRMAAMLADPAALMVPVWRNKNLIASGDTPRPALLDAERCRALIDIAPLTVFLGMYEERPCFALPLPPDDATVSHAALKGAGDFNDLRLAGSMLSRPEAELLAYARGMLHWHRYNGYCAKCGSDTQPGEGGFVRICRSCDTRHFPRTDPAIMALIVDGDRCLLARQPRFPPGMFSVLAGFVEPGESLEDAVVREVREEVGLEIADIRYLQSQPWPFPSSLMLGFEMRATSTDVRLDDEELEEARWFSRAQLRSPDGFFVPPPYSLAHQLIAHFLED